jgi:DNA-directed RNA polymerase specialized sigma24 family protein
MSKYRSSLSQRFHSAPGLPVCLPSAVCRSDSRACVKHCAGPANQDERRAGRVMESSTVDPILALLDPNPNDAERKLTQLRTSIILYFRSRGCLDPEDLADEVIYRAIRRLRQGVDCSAGLKAYCRGIAKFVLIEERRRVRADLLSENVNLAERPAPQKLSDSEKAILVKDCLKFLSREEAKLLSVYYWQDRKELAASLGVTANCLRIRVSRLLFKLSQRMSAASDLRGTHERARR